MSEHTVLSKPCERLPKQLPHLSGVNKGIVDTHFFACLKEGGATAS
jgi:hypothetical protein